MVVDVSVSPAPDALAFSNDGRALYASAGRKLVHIDIETISADGELQLPSRAAALAFPAGRELVVALPLQRTLGLLEGPNASITETEVLPGGADLLAGDRRDPRVVAAHRGGSWLAVYHVGDREMRTTIVEGRIAAVAVDRDRGAALVATSAPNRLTRIDLRELRVLSSIPLPAAPIAVVATSDGSVVASGRTLWAAGDRGLRRLADATKDVTHLAASDEGSVLLASGTDRIEAFSTKGRRLRELAVPDVAALAAVPAASSVAGDGGTGEGPGGDKDAKGELPATSTVVDQGARWIADRRELVAAVAFGGAVGLLVLGALVVAMRRHGRARRG